MLFTYRPLDDLSAATTSHHPLRLNGITASKIAMPMNFVCGIVNGVPTSAMGDGTTHHPSLDIGRQRCFQ